MARRAIMMFILAGCLQGAQAEEFLLLNPRTDKSELVEVSLHNKIRVQAHCLRAKKCEALQALSKKPQIQEGGVDHLGYAINPTVISCQEVGGKSAIISDKGLNQFDICLFKDSSFFFSTDYWKTLKAQK